MVAVSRLVLVVRAAAVLAFALCLATPAFAGEPADRVLGQARFTTGSPNFVDGRGFVNPAGIAIDRSTILRTLR